ncbi:MAG: hypothetical protein V3V18_01265 [Methylococcales bacterium]
MKTAILIVFVSVLTNISVSVAEVRAQINWTGELKITGFSSLPGFPENSDNDPSTLTYEWTIDPDSSHTIGASICSAPEVSGTVALVDALGPGVDENLDINSLANIAMLLPPGTFNFPPGVTPPFENIGSPVSTIVLNEPGINLDTVLNVNQVNFDENVLTFQAQENVLSGIPASSLFNAEDAAPPNNGDGILTRPFIVDITLDCAECSLDVDGNGSYDALTDGLLVIRHMFGIQGESLIEDAVADDCTNCEVSEIETIIEECATSSIVDIDGNEEIDALTDGLLNMRYLFGFRGAPLINHSVGDNCTRCTVVEVENYIQNLLP